MAYGSSDFNINGVRFNRQTSAGSFSNSSAISVSNFNFSSASLGNAPATLGASYEVFLETAFGANGKALNISLNNLTVGNEYLVQLWTPYWDKNWPTRFQDGNGNNSSYLNLGGAASRAAQYVVGSFIANSTTQTIQSTGFEVWSVIAGVQVRTLSAVAAVPEPETYAMFMAGLGLLGFASRRKKA